MSYGHIYFATNSWMRHGMVKIGHTTKRPWDRLAELSSATGCPGDFFLLGSFGHPDAAFAEREIHKELAPYRINPRREFFMVAHFMLQEIARRWAVDDLDLENLEASIAEGN